MKNRVTNNTTNHIVLLAIYNARDQELNNYKNWLPSFTIHERENYGELENSDGNFRELHKDISENITNWGIMSANILINEEISTNLTSNK